MFSVLGKMELIRIDDAMWKLVEMRVDVMKMVTVKLFLLMLMVAVWNLITRSTICLSLLVVVEK